MNNEVLQFVCNILIISLYLFIQFDKLYLVNSSTFIKSFYNFCTCPKYHVNIHDNINIIKQTHLFNFTVFLCERTTYTCFMLHSAQPTEWKFRRWMGIQLYYHLILKTKPFPSTSTVENTFRIFEIS